VGGIDLAFSLEKRGRRRGGTFSGGEVHSKKGGENLEKRKKERPGE